MTTEIPKTESPTQAANCRLPMTAGEHEMSSSGRWV